MILYHYTNEKFDKFDLSKFGDNVYTSKDKRMYDIPRIYFYKDLADREQVLGRKKYVYTCEIPNIRLYDIREDFYRIKLDYFNVFDIITELIELHYDGMIYKHVCLFNVDNVKIKERKKQ